MKTYHGRVSPGMCDVNGHLNVVFYYQFFDSACWAFLAQLETETVEPNQSWADVEHTTNFLAEVPLGSDIYVLSCLERVGRSSLISNHSLYIQGDENVCATINIVTVRFDLKNRLSAALSYSIGERARSYLMAN